jgi:hypothetical protein
MMMVLKVLATRPPCRLQARTAAERWWRQGLQHWLRSPAANTGNRIASASSQQAIPNTEGVKGESSRNAPRTATSKGAGGMDRRGPLGLPAAGRCSHWQPTHLGIPRRVGIPMAAALRPHLTPRILRARERKQRQRLEPSFQGPTQGNSKIRPLRYPANLTVMKGGYCIGS